MARWLRTAEMSRLDLEDRKNCRPVRRDRDASLVFARDSQVYLLALCNEAISVEIHARTRDAFGVFMARINQALSPDREFIVGDGLTLADICFVS